ncbi:high affinity cAMP-specific and IBMX-insensitive 3',5'-cyclic phosphodiesterase 8A-like isoform X9 [Tachypleus tridentatus]|uniref:high affinity cAMP-specific and IBMX-insensitive 3',5'-cyclic phosphodiesterase 8A-like isoform X9 n=1 Tax=Tachypleus tridentatus TaxID=6853 RepID=UPI003FD2B7C2
MGCTPSINQSGVVRCQESDQSSFDTNPNNHQMNWLEGRFRKMVSSDEAVESGGSTGNSLQIVSCSKSGTVQSDQNTSAHWMYRERDLKRTSNTLKFGPMCLTLPTIKVLLVFDKEDSQCKALKMAVEKLQYEYVVVTSGTQALDLIRNSHYHLVIVDTRHPCGFDPFLLARSFRLSKDNHYSCFVAVVKRSLAEKEDSFIFKILTAGFDRDWEGSGFRKRKTTQQTPMWNRVIPVDVHNGANEHTVLVREGRSSSFYSEKSFIPDSDFLPYTLTNMKSIRNPSYDVRSLCSEAGMNRRQSLARLHTMTIEAPITKVINMLLATQENSPNFVAKDIDKILEILRTSDLYSPQLLGFNQHRRPTDDKLTSDLISSLVMQGQKSGQRRFSHDINQKVSRSSIVSSLASIPSLDSAPKAIVSCLEKSMEWSFDILELERISEKRALTWLGMTVFSSFNACSVLSCDEKTLRSWLSLIEANYCNNPYHNSTHAADVMQATALFLQKPRLKAIFDPLDEVISLIAAVVHDVNHPGKNSAFLCNTKDELAILYNDLSVLESYHAARAFKLTLSDKSVNILQHLDRDTYQAVRESIIDMVLATEMTKHFEHLSKFVNVLKAVVPNEEVEDDKQPENCQEVLMTMSSPENVKLVKRILIKCADISNAARPTKLCVEWATRITEEYCRQTDEEKTKALPVVMPTFDRTTMSLPKAQMGFIDYFINDMFSSWDAFVDFPELIDHIQSNYQYWREQEDERQEKEVSKEES